MPKRRVDEIEFVLLNSYEVVVAWDMLFMGLKVSGLYSGDPQVARILMDAIAGHLQVWLMKERMEDGSPNLVGIVCTQVHEQPYLGRKRFTITHTHANDVVGIKAWKQVYETLDKYARDIGCTVAEIYTENKRAARLLEGFGFKAIGAYQKELV